MEQPLHFVRSVGTTFFVKRRLFHQTRCSHKVNSPLQEGMMEEILGYVLEIDEYLGPMESRV